MTFKTTTFVAAAAAIILPALPSFAQQPQSYGAVLKRGTTVTQAQQREYQAPGNTQELSYDAKESATGGPAGGLGRGGAGG